MRKGLVRQAEVARRLGIPPSTLHRWIRKGIVRPSLVTEDGGKLFSISDVERLRRYVQLREMFRGVTHETSTH